MAWIETLRWDRTAGEWPAQHGLSPPGCDSASKLGVGFVQQSTRTRRLWPALTHLSAT